MTRQKFSETLYLIGLFLLVAAMPLSIFMMSVSQFILLASWFISGNIFEKIKSAFSNSVIAILALVYFMHLIGVMYSTDYDYFFKDVRIKLPLLILPVLIFTSPAISNKWFNRIMSVFVFSVLTSTIISMGVLYDILPHKHPVNDIRDISVFVSHIRLSLFICISIFTCGYFIFLNRTKNFLYTLLSALVICWFIIFLFILEAMTGVVILIVTSVFLLLTFVFRQKSIAPKIIAALIAIIIPASIYLYLKNEALKIYRPQKVDFSSLPKTTANGNNYVHCETCTDQENGNLVWTFFCEPEISKAWNQRSRLNYNGRDLRGNELKFTLIRFLTSKGLRKDSAGVFQMNESEIHSVENGIANINYQHLGNLKIRIDKTIAEYYDLKNKKNPTGSSLIQRIEFWKAGWNIFRQNLLLGVGTGDVQKAFDAEYIRVNSPLSKEWRLRAHNQYLTFALTFGLAGFLLFAFSLFYPFIKMKKYLDFFYLPFFIILLISMLTEDTLETQAGVTFYAFFNSFFLFSRNENSPNKSS